MPTPAQDAQILLEKIQSLPPDRITEVEDFVDFLRARIKHRKTVMPHKKPLNFPVDDLGPWPDGLSLHREDLYGDDGR